MLSSYGLLFSLLLFYQRFTYLLIITESCSTELHLQDATKMKNHSVLPLIQTRSRPAVGAGYLCSLTTAVISSSSTVTGTATATDSVTPQGTSGSATNIFINWLKFSIKVGMTLLFYTEILSDVLTALILLHCLATSMFVMSETFLVFLIRLLFNVFEILHGVVVYMTQW